MRTSYNLTNAQQVVDEYVAELNKPDVIPAKIASRTWLEFCLERHRIIPDVRKLQLGEAHALWYACLIVTKTVRKVSRLESKLMPNTRPGGTTENTIRRMLKGNLRDNIAASYLKEALETYSKQ